MEKTIKMAGTSSRKRTLETSLLHRLFHFWVIDLAVSFINFTVLTQVYQPAWGELAAHQVGMLTRIVYIFVISYFILRSIKKFTNKDLIQLGVMWMTLWLVFEWGGSLLIGRPVAEILIGWNIFAGYIWPYVLTAYLLSSLILGNTVYQVQRAPLSRIGYA